MPAYIQRPDIYIVMGESKEEKAFGFRLATDLRKNNYAIEYALKPIAIGKQIKDAYLSQAPWIIICGEEVAQQSFKAIHVATKTEYTLTQEAFLEQLISG